MSAAPKAERGGDDAAPTSVKDLDVYRALRADGASKGKAARIANAAARDGRSAIGRRGGESEDYQDRTKSELVELARERNIRGRSTMSKSDLIEALRTR